MPSAEENSSTAIWAVRFRTSSVGFTSATSIERSPPLVATHSGHRRPDPGSDIRVEAVHVQTQVEAVRPAKCAGNRLLHHGIEAPAVDLFHGEYPHAEFRNHPGFGLIHAPRADDGRVGGIETRGAPREPTHANERIGAPAEQGRKRHSVQVAARRRLGGVRIGVGVDPEQAETFGAPSSAGCRIAATRHSGNGANRHRVVTPQDHGQQSATPDLANSPGQITQHPRHRIEITGLEISGIEGLGDGSLEISGVLHAVSEPPEPSRQPCPPHR